LKKQVAMSDEEPTPLPEQGLTNGSKNKELTTYIAYDGEDSGNSSSDEDRGQHNSNSTSDEEGGDEEQDDVEVIVNPYVSLGTGDDDNDNDGTDEEDSEYGPYIDAALHAALDNQILDFTPRSDGPFVRDVEPRQGLNRGQQIEQERERDIYSSTSTSTSKLLKSESILNSDSDSDSVIFQPKEVLQIPMDQNKVDLIRQSMSKLKLTPRVGSHAEAMATAILRKYTKEQQQR
jgi:hypothetical protein